MNTCTNFVPIIDYSRLKVVDKKNEIYVRIREIVSHYGLTNATFADAIKVPRSSFHTILNEEREIKYSLLIAIIDKFPELSLTWLMTGTGHMLSDETERIKQLETDLEEAKKNLKRFEVIERLREENEALKKN